MTRHVPMVVTSYQRAGTHYYGTCGPTTCDWRGPNRATWDEAADDCRGHDAPAFEEHQARQDAARAVYATARDLMDKGDETGDWDAALDWARSLPAADAPWVPHVRAAIIAKASRHIYPREALDAAIQTVLDADAAWAADLDDETLHQAYLAAKRQYRDVEAIILGKGLYEVRPCPRCGGAGGWEGWPGYTCYECGGHKTVTRAYRKYRFDADPRVRARREAKRVAEIAAADQAYADAIRTLGDIGSAIDAARATQDAWTDRYETPKPRHGTDFMAQLAGKLRKYGSLTQGQIDAARRIMDGWVREDAEKAALADAPALTAGRYVIEGTVVSHKWTDDDGPYGSQHKMLVKLDDGNKVWGTVPAAIEDAMRDSWDDDGTLIPAQVDDLKGARVQLTATVTVSHDDPHFGYYGNPRTAAVLTAEEAQQR